MRGGYLSGPGLKKVSGANTFCKPIHCTTKPTHCNGWASQWVDETETKIEMGMELGHLPFLCIGFLAFFPRENRILVSKSFRELL